MSESDDDLKMAIAMSLQRDSDRPQSQSQMAIDLTSDTEDEDEDLRRAIALSVQETQDDTSKPSASRLIEDHAQDTSRVIYNSKESDHKSVELSKPTLAETKASPIFGGLDRKTMEAERLARLSKRKRDPSPDRPSKQIARASRHDNSHPRNHTPDLACFEYPNGVIKRTSATKYPRSEDMSIDELLQASTVNIAVISSFMWDAEWLQKKLNPAKVKQIWIMNAKGQDVQARWIQEMQDAAIPNLKLHFPPMDGMIQSMHNKFMLLFGKDKLRVVVTTANMTQIDWGEVANDWQPGVMENTIFLIDLPRRADGRQSEAAQLNRFGQELIYFLEQQKVARNVIDGVLKFDFEHTSHLAFVHSV